MEILAERLFALRKEKKWSQQEAAKQLDIAFRSYRRYEAGEREPPISALVHIADIYNVSLDYLAGRINDRGEK